VPTHMHMCNSANLPKKRNQKQSVGPTQITIDCQMQNNVTVDLKVTDCKEADGGLWLRIFQ